ncbi:MAG: glutamate-cysteine ligase family protein, partial [Wenzhouxiangella sp.]
MNPEDVLTRPQQLADWLASGARPKSEWRIGTEHEKFGFLTDTLEPLKYEGPAGVRAMLEGLSHRFDWEIVNEDGLPIALKKPDGCSITLEPGGQLELSGALLDNLHETCSEVNSHLAEVRAVAEPLGIGFIGLGFHPTATRADIEWMPKARYVIMRNYMPKVGTMGIDMMKRTCTVQVNLDFSSEA